MQPLIEFKNTVFSANADRKIINNISTYIYPGDFVVILGGNGSGKSTLLKLINRTYPLSSGEINFKNKPITSYDFKSIRKEMVTITQFISDSIFVDLTIEENALLIDEGKTDLTTLRTYLAEFNPQLAKALKTRVKNLSGGEQQILAFALYLRRQPGLLLLDEHTSALDPKKSDNVMAITHQIIAQKKITCLMTTHQLDYAIKYGNRLMAIREGEIAFEANREEKSKLTITDLLKYCY
ncbi:MAG: ATP-binding cassette domain-containing protein [Gammaproteobacteria bacterium]|nr:ATP-binding cassette domain-containing protein [Gammaproteobacteria bacterium]